MTDVWCPDCRFYMNKVKVGIEVETVWGTLRRGDQYECAKCGKKVISDFGNSYSRTGKL